MKRLLLFVVLITIEFSCSVLTDHPVNPDPTSSFTVSETEVSPFEVMTFALTEPSILPIIKGKIGPEDFEARQVTDKLYTVLVPPTLAEGTYDFSLEDYKTSVSIKVKPIKEIASPNAYSEAYIADVKEIINSRLLPMQDILVERNISSTQTITQERELLGANIKLAMERFNALSDENKMNYARFIDANKAAFDEIGILLANVNFEITPNPGGRTLSFCNEASTLGNIKCQIINFSEAVLKIQDLRAALATTSKFKDEPFVAAAIQTLSDVVALETMIEAKNVSKKLTRLAYILSEPVVILTDADSITSDFNFKNDVSDSFKVNVKVRNIQEDPDLNSVVPFNKAFAEKLKSFIAAWNAFVGNSLADKPDFAPLSEEIISPDVATDISVDIVNNQNIKPDYSFKDGVLTVSLKTTETTDQTFDLKVIYKYDGMEASITKNASLAKPIVLGDTAWDFTLIYSPSLSWHANVTFKADGTTIYDEPDHPGDYTAYGDWKLTGDKLHWYLDKAREKTFSFDGTVSGNTMSGTFTPEKRVWTAVKL